MSVRHYMCMSKMLKPFIYNGVMNVLGIMLTTRLCYLENE